MSDAYPDPYIPATANTYDILLNISGDTIVLSDLDQTEVMRFMSLMPKIFIRRYFRDTITPKWTMQPHQESSDGNSNE